MKPFFRLVGPLGLAAALAGCATAAPPENTYPTFDRVRYVGDCMREHTGSSYELMAKCSCTIDAIAREVPFEEFDLMYTAAKANTIGGERGSYIREARPMQVKIRAFRDIQARAKQACFLTP